MKRTVEKMDDCLTGTEGPCTKVVLVEREPNPLGVPLVNATKVAKRSYLDAMDLEEGSSNANTFVQANAKNRIDFIGKQMKNLQDLMVDVIEETQLATELHNVACNFVKKPGHIYHLYKRPSGQQYLGMLSPEEWQISPHEYLGSYFLDADQSWTPAEKIHNRYEGLKYLKQMFGKNQAALT